ncbi:MAG: hypothetical protein ABH859_02415 [Pseudomonadota bacterium]
MDYFLLRRFHSILNILVYGYFLGLHFFLSSSHLFPKVWTFELIALEVALFIYFLLSLLFIYKCSVNIIAYPYYQNWLYFLQIITTFFSFIFITYYLWNIGRHDYANLGQYFSSLGAKIFYVIGMVSVAIHFANGLTNALASWGITVSNASQKGMTIISWAIMLCLTFWSLIIL